MYYFGGGTCGCNMQTPYFYYPNCSFGWSNNNNSNYAIILVLFILLVIVIGARFTR